jgi:cytochrome c oxidase cbb3-type subunit 3
MACTRFAVIVPLGLLSFPCHADAASATDAGQEFYRSVCSACHGPENVMVSAPKAGDIAEWGRRLARGAKGIETLTDNAINGFAAMPAKGGRSELSRVQIRQAIEFMMTSRNSTAPPDLR